MTSSEASAGQWSVSRTTRTLRAASSRGKSNKIANIYILDLTDPPCLPPLYLCSLSHPEPLLKDFTDLLLPFLRGDCGATHVAFAGFCFGGYVAYLYSQLPGALCCAAGAHSSIRIFNMHSSNEREATAKVTCPQMLLQAANDSPSGKPASDVHELLASMPFGDRCVLREFPDVLHGWLPRGDLSQAHVRRDVQEAMRLIVSFLHNNMM
ncbi:hypothetical protein EON64_11715 [archaeon]|nr:MAG: hypothetical protein EON64_11715 [archaeon]